jgi:hypothetical protein
MNNEYSPPAPSPPAQTRPLAASCWQPPRQPRMCSSGWFDQQGLPGSTRDTWRWPCGAKDSPCCALTGLRLGRSRAGHGSRDASVPPAIRTRHARGRANGVQGCARTPPDRRIRRRHSAGTARGPPNLSRGAQAAARGGTRYPRRVAPASRRHSGRERVFAPSIAPGWPPSGGERGRGPRPA